MRPGASQTIMKALCRLSAPTRRLEEMKNGAVQIHPIIAKPFQITSRFNWRNPPATDAPNSTDSPWDWFTKYALVKRASAPTPPTAYTRLPAHTTIQPHSTPQPSKMDLIDRVPAQAEMNHSGANKINRSGRNPLPTPSAQAPQRTKPLS